MKGRVGLRSAVGEVDYVGATKVRLRAMVWSRMEEEGVARFPLPVHERIPNFVGAESAAKALTATEEWRRVRVVKSNPDAPQRALRAAALQQGKQLYMAVPRLRELKCFVELDPRRVLSPSKASTIRGAFSQGRTVHPDEMEAIDLVVSGCVAVDRSGGRVGKGGGFSDLEYALCRSLGLISDGVPIVSTVHDIQVVEEAIPMTPHDFPLDTVATPKGAWGTNTQHRRPEGIDWALLKEDQLASMPIIAEMRRRGL